MPLFIRTRTVEILKHKGNQFIIFVCFRYDRTKIAYEHGINVLEYLDIDLSMSASVSKNIALCGPGEEIDNIGFILMAADVQ
jgi:hypothetical protein